jgi:hypothetical protein
VQDHIRSNAGGDAQRAYIYLQNGRVVPFLSFHYASLIEWPIPLRYRAYAVSMDANE